MSAMAFIFQSAVISQVEKEQFLANCPYPIYNGEAYFTPSDGIQGTRLTYHVNYTATSYNNTTTNNGSFFRCYRDPVTDAKVASIDSKPYGSNFLSLFPYGWLAWVADSGAVFFDRVQHTFGALLLQINAPAQISSLSFFTYINVALIGFMALGGYMLIRRG